MSFAATVTRARTPAADLGVTLIARTDIIFINGAAAVPTLGARPVTQRCVGTVWVVGVQDLMHDCEKVMQPPFGQSQLDRPVALAFAENFRLHVRMSRRVTAGRWVWIDCDRAIGT